MTANKMPRPPTTATATTAMAPLDSCEFESSDAVVANKFGVDGEPLGGVDGGCGEIRLIWGAASNCSTGSPRAAERDSIELVRPMRVLRALTRMAASRASIIVTTRTLADVTMSVMSSEETPSSWKARLALYAVLLREERSTPRMMVKEMTWYSREFGDNGEGRGASGGESNAEGVGCNGGADGDRAFCSSLAQQPTQLHEIAESCWHVSC